MEFFSHKEKIIGIPRALIYYNFYPFWYGFFTKLGIKIVLSSPTTKQTMTDGSSLVVSETCLPIKVYVGHVVDLVNKDWKSIQSYVNTKCIGFLETLFIQYLLNKI